MPNTNHTEDSESESSEEEQQFVVEVIKAARVRKGRWEYRVKWANYDSSDDTWEPEKNLTNCRRLLSSFWENVGMDNNDYFEGYEVMATPTWIKLEKKLFAGTLNKRGVQESSSGEDEPMPPTLPRIKTESTSKTKFKAPPIKKRGRRPKAKSKRERSLEHEEDEEDDSDNIPLSTTRKKGKQRAKPIVSSDDDDGDDEPLAKAKKVTIRLPPSKKPPEVHNQDEAEQSDSAGSLFSEKSSPEIALHSLPPTKDPPQSTKSSVPTKRPTLDDASQGPRKRQVMEMPMAITGTAGIATKARLAQRMAQNMQQPSVSGKNEFLKTVKFKKNTPADPPSSQAPKPALPPLPRRSGSATDHPLPASHGQGTSTIETPHPLSTAPPLLPAESRPSIPLPRRNPSLQQQAQSPVIDHMSEADKFLSDIMPAAMASPMRDDQASDKPPPPAPMRPAQIKAAALPRIQKKWKWTGDLFMDVSRDRAERVCSVLLSESTDPLPNGLRFSICLTGDSIRMSAFHHLRSLPLFLLASTRAQQFAKVGPAEEVDADAIKQIGIYMLKNSLFCFAHLYMDNASVGLLLIFPSGHKITMDLLKPPPTLSSDTPLQVALIPWELTTKEFRAHTWKTRSPTLESALDTKFIPFLDSAGRRVVTQRRFYQALHILRFPKGVYDYMTVTPRTYCIWIGDADTTSNGSGYETSLLRMVLSTCKAQDVGLKADVKIIFVHVGGLASLQHLVALAERRMKTNLRFMTYGSHPSVPRERWGMREIYPVGGILTFTPTAIIQNHGMLFKFVKKVSEHPVWDCYVLPSVVAMVAKLTCQGQHPLRAYDEGEFVYEELLELIEQGSLSLAQAPPFSRDLLAKNDASLAWTRWTLRLPAMNARQILEECLKLAAEQFASIAEADLPRVIEEEIARDLWRLQNQPVIMDNYRRFTVVRTQNDKHLCRDMRGFECTTLANFKFGDDCFESTTRPEAKGVEKR